jgi:hypothetical protein
VGVLGNSRAWAALDDILNVRLCMVELAMGKGIGLVYRPGVSEWD